MPFAIAVSGARAGSNMNDRSLRRPSPLTSPETSGVKNPPEVTRAIAVSSNTGLTGHVAVARNAWRRLKSLVPRSAMFGSPAVVAPAPRPPKLATPRASSRDRMKVYDVVNRAARPVIPQMLAVTCFVSDRRSDVTSLTTPKRGFRLEPLRAEAPVAGTIELAGVYTGRPPSVASENPRPVCRLRSVALVWATPREYATSTETLSRSAIRRLAPSEPRQARGAPN